MFKPLKYAPNFYRSLGFLFFYYDLPSVEIVHILYFCFASIILKRNLCVVWNNNDNSVDSVENGKFFVKGQKNREKEGACQSDIVFLCV